MPFPNKVVKEKLKNTGNRAILGTERRREGRKSEAINANGRKNEPQFPEDWLSNSMQPHVHDKNVSTPPSFEKRSHRYHHVMPSSSGVVLVDAAVVSASVLIPLMEAGFGTTRGFPHSDSRLDCSDFRVLWLVFLTSITSDGFLFPVEHGIEGLLGHLIGSLEMSHDLLYCYHVWSALSPQAQQIHLKRVARDSASTGRCHLFTPTKEDKLFCHKKCSAFNLKCTQSQRIKDSPTGLLGSRIIATDHIVGRAHPLKELSIHILGIAVIRDVNQIHGLWVHHADIRMARRWSRVLEGHRRRIGMPVAREPPPTDRCSGDCRLKSSAKEWSGESWPNSIDIVECSGDLVSCVRLFLFGEMSGEIDMGLGQSSLDGDPSASWKVVGV
ncbi:hypothetical protein EYF80_021596 [Liparis tanakae]|uniref:Uncharacterized protein n=1 Tax=Liparis tanakae TaxID=230148 RepID=A0A4Z2HT22_9TELE|nr:hypothetical protein EYF80_021596 [Liparis tanakae]